MGLVGDIAGLFDQNAQQVKLLNAQANYDAVQLAAAQQAKGSTVSPLVYVLIAVSVIVIGVALFFVFRPKKT